MNKSHHKTAVPVAVFDISSSSVGGAHVLMNTEKGNHAFLAQYRIDAPLSEEVSIDRFISGTAKNLELVVQNIQKADKHQPKHIQLVLASPWYVSQTRAVIYKKEDGFTCNQKLIDSLVQKEVEFMLANDMERFGDFGHDAAIVEKQISLIKLNGYPTNDPFGKKAKELELFLTVTITPKVIAERFTTILKRVYGSRSINITTSPYTTFVTARDHFSVDDESVVIDVGEEVTDVAFAKDGFFLYQHSFPVGTYELYRHIHTQGNRMPEESKALLEAYRLGKIGAQAKKTVEKAVDSFAALWQSELQKILDDGHFGFCLPEQCFIVSDPRFEQIFTNIIKTDPYIQHTCSRGLVRPIFITQEMIKDKVRSIDIMAPDVPLATAALFVERMM